MNERSVIQRLRDAVPVLKLVGGAAEYETASLALAALPAAFVLPAAETAEDNTFMDQLVQQRVGEELVVITAVRNLADAQAAAALETLKPVRLALRTALLGWVPDDADDGCEFVRGEFLAFTNGVLWWQDFYRTAYMIRSV